MRDQELRDQIAALFGDGDDTTAVLEVVAPLLAEAEAEVRRLREDLTTAVEMVKTCTGHPDTGQPSHFDLIQRAEASRRDWAAEALSLQDEVDTLTQPLYWEKPHPFSNDDVWPKACRTCGGEPEEELHQTQDAEPPVTVCACVTDEQAAQLAPGFSRPVCAVHPEGGEA